MKASSVYTYTKKITKGGGCAQVVPSLELPADGKYAT